MRLLQLLGVSSRSTEQRTAFRNLIQLVLKTDQVVFQVVDFVFDLLGPVGRNLGQTPVELLECPQVVFPLVLWYVLLVG